jgi:hypothetical protein
MKKAILFGILCLTIFSSFAQQQKNWVSKKIGQWSFEKFPIHYFVTPAKAISSRNLLTGKLESYTEYNQYGQQEGLSLTMRADGIFPSGAIYTYKGVTVYQVTFFPNSNTPESISNSNKDMADDGYQIRRYLKSSGGYTEEVEKYNNSVIIERDGIKVSNTSQKPAFDNDSLLDGRFKYKSDNWTEIEGEASHGKLKRIKQVYDGRYMIKELIVIKDSFIYRTKSQQSDKWDTETFPLHSNPSVTNSKSICLAHGSMNYPFMFFNDNYTIVDFKDALETKHP